VGSKLARDCVSCGGDFLKTLTTKQSETRLLPGEVYSNLSEKENTEPAIPIWGSITVVYIIVTSLDNPSWAHKEVLPEYLWT
jgi:hypothetical protein